MNVFLNVLSQVIAITGCTGAVVGAFLWEKILRRFYYQFKYRKIKANNDYILIISLRKNIASTKEKILSQAENSLKHLANLPMEVIKLPDDCTAATRSEMFDEIEGVRINMAKNKKFTIHLFYNGPVVLTAFIGGYFYNKDKVYIYHQDFNKKEYECWGPLA